MAVFCAYVSYVDKNWLSINIIALGVSYLAFILAFLCPESPRWYLVNGRREKGIQTLNYISKFNGMPGKIPRDAQFVESETAPTADKKVVADKSIEALGLR